MPTNIPWSKTIAGSGHYCAICHSKGKVFSLATGMDKFKKGFWKEVRERIVKHFESEHPEYKVVRLREGPK